MENQNIFCAERPPDNSIDEVIKGLEELLSEHGAKIEIELLEAPDVIKGTVNGVYEEHRQWFRIFFSNHDLNREHISIMDYCLPNPDDKTSMWNFALSIQNAVYSKLNKPNDEKYQALWDKF